MQEFLERMDTVLPWKKFVFEITPYYPTLFAKMYSADEEPSNVTV